MTILSFSFYYCFFSIPSNLLSPLIRYAISLVASAPSIVVLPRLPRFLPRNPPWQPPHPSLGAASQPCPRAHQRHSIPASAPRPAHAPPLPYGHMPVPRALSVAHQWTHITMSRASTAMPMATRSRDMSLDSHTSVAACVRATSIRRAISPNDRSRPCREPR
jgi:hypothetical protein